MLYLQPFNRLQLFCKLTQLGIATFDARCKTFRFKRKFSTETQEKTIQAETTSTAGEGNYGIFNPESSKCEPTELLVEMMQKDKTIEEKVQRIQKEYEIYKYFSDFIPRVFTDANWILLLKTTSIVERVSYWWFMGLTQFRELKDAKLKQIHLEKMKLTKRQQEKILAAGGMGYGSAENLHKLLMNPSNLEMDKKFFTSYAMQFAMQQLPNLLFDFQFVPQQKPHEYRRVMRSSTNAYITNLMQRNPFPMSFINVNLDDISTTNFIESKFNKQSENFIRPDIYRNNPFHNPHETDPKKQVIYISRNAKVMIDGPLIHRAYVIPLSFDMSRETIAAINNDHYRTMALPIQRYIKGLSGPRKISFPVLVKILHEVANNGGDWAQALDMYIPLTMRITVEERKNLMGEERYNTMREHWNQKQEIIQSIQDSLGHQPRAFVESSKFNESPTLYEYARRVGKF